MKAQKHILSAALTGAVALAMAQGALANPFETTALKDGYQIAHSDAKAKDGKCGEGKCGAMDDTDKSKVKDGKCGEGKCGAKHGKGKGKAKGSKCSEGKCGAKS